MASPPYQIAAFFTDLDGHGWSEKYYTSINFSPSVADTFVAGFVPARMAMATTSVQMSHVRIGSAVGRAPFAYFPTETQGSKGTLAPPTLPTDIGLLMQLISNNRYYNKVFLRGIPEAKVNLEEVIGYAPFDNAFAAFVSFMLGTGQIVIRTVLGTAAPKQSIVKLTHQSPKGVRLVILATAPVLSVGETIRIHGVSIPGYNGLKTVVSGPFTTTDGPTYILGGANPISDPPVTDNFYYTEPTISMPALADITIERVTSRKTGRPFDLPRGRARTLFSQRP